MDDNNLSVILSFYNIKKKGFCTSKSLFLMMKANPGRWPSIALLPALIRVAALS